MKQKIKRLSLRLIIILLGIIFFGTRSNAQTISYTSLSSAICSADTFQVWVTGCTAGDTVVTSWGDGTFESQPVGCGGGAGNAYFLPGHVYPATGEYTLKLVLYAGGIAVDSLQKVQFFTCTEIQCFVYDDVNADCSFDAGDTYIYGEPTTLEIDSAGTPLDTITTTCGFTYPILGPNGTIYSFKVIKAPYGYGISCPVDSIKYDTIGTTVNEPSIGFKCDSTDAFDLAISAFFRPGITGAESDVFVTNSSCDLIPSTVTINYNPAYIFDSFLYWDSPYTYTVSGSSVTINLGGISSNNSGFFLAMFSPLVTLTLGDTIKNNFEVNPLIGDVDTTNNFITTSDTVRTAWDPNYKSVTPTGNIAPGTLLKYMIAFENTGNDTAFNIHIMDTLSNNLDINTFKVVSCTAPMNLIMLSSGGQNIVKFDFPNINLLDTAQHSDFSGIVTYTIQAKTGLPVGTKIDNDAGIYFDANPVVITNNVENIIGIPATSVATLNNASQISIYPNPATTQLTIQSTNQQINQITITNLLGQTVYTGVPNTQIAQVDVSALSAGVYFIKINGAQVSKFAKL